MRGNHFFSLLGSKLLGTHQGQPQTPTNQEEEKGGEHHPTSQMGIDEVIRLCLKQKPFAPEVARHPQLSALALLRLLPPPVTSTTVALKSSTCLSGSDVMQPTVSDGSVGTVGELYDYALAQHAIPPDTSFEIFWKCVHALSPMMLAVDFPSPARAAGRYGNEYRGDAAAAAVVTQGGEAGRNTCVTWQPWISSSLYSSLLTSVPPTVASTALTTKDTSTVSHIAMTATTSARTYSLEAGWWRLFLAVVPSYFISIPAAQYALQQQSRTTQLSSVSLITAAPTTLEALLIPLLSSSPSRGVTQDHSQQHRRFSPVEWSPDHTAFRLMPLQECIHHCLDGALNNTETREECVEVIRTFYGLANEVYRLLPQRPSLFHAGLDMLARVVPCQFTSIDAIQMWYIHILHEQQLHHEEEEAKRKDEENSMRISGVVRDEQQLVHLEQLFPCAEALLDHPDMACALDVRDRASLEILPIATNGSSSGGRQLSKLVVRLHPHFAHVRRGDADGLPLVADDSLCQPLHSSSSNPLIQKSTAMPDQYTRVTTMHIYKVGDRSRVAADVATSSHLDTSTKATWNTTSTPTTSAEAACDAIPGCCLTLIAQADQLAVAWCASITDVHVFTCHLTTQEAGEGNREEAEKKALSRVAKLLPLSLVELITSETTLLVMAQTNTSDTTADACLGSCVARRLRTYLQCRGPTCDLSSIVKFAGCPLDSTFSSSSLSIITTAAAVALLNQRMGLALTMATPLSVSHSDNKISSNGLDLTNSEANGVCAEAAHTVLACAALLRAADADERCSFSFTAGIADGAGAESSLCRTFFNWQRDALSSTDAAGQGQSRCCSSHSYFEDHGFLLRLRRYMRLLGQAGVGREAVPAGLLASQDSLMGLSLGAKEQLLQWLVSRYGPEPFPRPPSALSITARSECGRDAEVADTFPAGAAVPIAALLRECEEYEVADSGASASDAVQDNGEGSQGDLQEEERKQDNAKGEVGNASAHSAAAAAAEEKDSSFLAAERLLDAIEALSPSSASSLLTAAAAGASSTTEPSAGPPPSTLSITGKAWDAVSELVAEAERAHLVEAATCLVQQRQQQQQQPHPRTSASLPSLSEQGTDAFSTQLVADMSSSNGSCSPSSSSPTSPSFSSQVPQPPPPPFPPYAPPLPPPLPLRVKNSASVPVAAAATAAPPPGTFDPSLFSSRICKSGGGCLGSIFEVPDTAQQRDTLRSSLRGLPHSFSAGGSSRGRDRSGGSSGAGSFRRHQRGGSGGYQSQWGSSEGENRRGYDRHHRRQGSGQSWEGHRDHQRQARSAPERSSSFGLPTRELCRASSQQNVNQASGEGLALEAAPPLFSRQQRQQEEPKESLHAGEISDHTATGDSTGSVSHEEERLRDLVSEIVDFTTPRSGAELHSRERMRSRSGDHLLAASALPGVQNSSDLRSLLRTDAGRALLRELLLDRP